MSEAKKIRAFGCEFEIEAACLDVRWWTWTEWCECRWLPLKEHRVVTFGYHDINGATQIIWATEDGRLFFGSPFNLFPIVDQAAALDGAEAFRDHVLQRLAVEPSLL